MWFYMLRHCAYGHLPDNVQLGDSVEGQWLIRDSLIYFSTANQEEYGLANHLLVFVGEVQKIWKACVPIGHSSIRNK